MSSSCASSTDNSFVRAANRTTELHRRLNKRRRHHRRNNDDDDDDDDDNDEFSNSSRQYGSTDGSTASARRRNRRDRQYRNDDIVLPIVAPIEADDIDDLLSDTLRAPLPAPLPPPPPLLPPTSNAPVRVSNAQITAHINDSVNGTGNVALNAYRPVSLLQVPLVYSREHRASRITSAVAIAPPSSSSSSSSALSSVSSSSSQHSRTSSISLQQNDNSSSGERGGGGGGSSRQSHQNTHIPLSLADYCPSDDNDDNNDQENNEDEGLTNDLQRISELGRHDENEFCYACHFKQKHNGVMPVNVHHQKIETYLRDNYGHVDPFTLGTTAQRIYNQELRRHDKSLPDWTPQMILRHVEQHQMDPRVVLQNQARTYNQCLIRFRDQGLFVQQHDQVIVDSTQLALYIRVGKELNTVMSKLERMEN